MNNEKLMRSNSMEFLMVEIKQKLDLMDKFKILHSNFKLHKKATSLWVRWFRIRSR